MLTMSADDKAACDVSRMSPVSFVGCFGWLHAPADGAAGDVAVVLCAGLKNDAITAYRSFRLLADAMAAAGYPTLRFDYPGTGNSCDSAEPEHWAAWQRSVHAAADWLREQSGARRVVLCGLRFGATLAAVVAEQRDDVAGLLLLEPALRGNSYLRQLSIEAMLHDPGAQAGGGLVLHELHLSRETVALISQVDLRKVALPPACPVAVYAQTTTPVLHACAEVWRRRGAQVTCEEFAGLEPMLRPVFMNHEPPADAARIVAWLKVAVPARSASPRQARALGDAVLRTAGYVETPLRFGRADNLFGILCRPSASSPDHPGAEVVVVIGNGGGLPHSAAVSVDLARRLAAAGIASLRMDFAGVADSVATDDAGTHLFESDRRPDFVAALDALERLGFRRFALEGMCSGAYHAWHAALADARVEHLLLVNLPMFQWRAGTPIEYLNHLVESPGNLLSKLGRRDLWLQLLRGQLDLRSRFAALTVWLRGKTKATSRRLMASFGVRMPLGFAQAGMRSLAERTRTLLLFSERDAGLAVVTQVFGANRSPPGATLRVVSGIDHALTGRDMQRIAAEEIIAFLRREPAARTADHLARPRLTDVPVPAGPSPAP